MMNSSLFKFELDRFRNNFNHFNASLLPIKINDHIYSINSNSGDEFDLAISVFIHGNEVGGLVALNNLISNAEMQAIFVNKKIVFILGNLAAAEKNVRFVERDLNRCFGGNSEQTLEDRLSRLIEPYLCRTKIALDIHQTINPTNTDFFIFPEDIKNIAYARHLNQTAPIVVHEKDFSKDGMCLDTFVTVNGGIGITYEMGQISDIESRLPKTQNILLLAIENSFDINKIYSKTHDNIYTWGEIFYSAKNKKLIPGLKNFSFVAAGTTIGFTSDSEIKISKDGYILFPKYGEAAEKSAELCRTICPLKQAAEKTLSPMLKVNDYAL